jgi:hypothetical protein
VRWRVARVAARCLTRRRCGVADLELEMMALPIGVMMDTLERAGRDAGVELMGYRSAEWGLWKEGSWRGGLEKMAVLKV